MGCCESRPPKPATDDDWIEPKKRSTCAEWCCTCSKKCAFTWACACPCILITLVVLAAILYLGVQTAERAPPLDIATAIKGKPFASQFVTTVELSSTFADGLGDALASATSDSSKRFKAVVDLFFATEGTGLKVGAPKIVSSRRQRRLSASAALEGADDSMSAAHERAPGWLAGAASGAWGTDTDELFSAERRRLATDTVLLEFELDGDGQASQEALDKLALQLANSDSDFYKAVSSSVQLAVADILVRNDLNAKLSDVTTKSVGFRYSDVFLQCEMYEPFLSGPACGGTINALLSSGLFDVSETLNAFDSGCAFGEAPVAFLEA